MELGRRHDEPVPRARSGAVARARPQSRRAAAADSDRQARGARLAARAAQPDQLRLPPDAGVPARPRTPGARGTPACCGRGRSRTSRPSSACTSRCRSTRAASASSPAITSRARRTSASRSSASACTTTRATSGSGSTATAGSTRTTSTSTAALLPMQPATRGRRSRSSSDRDPHGRRSARASGSWRSAATRCCCSTRTSRATARKTASSPRGCMAATSRVRIRQELLLGVGGVRALQRAGHLAGRRSPERRTQRVCARSSWSGSAWTTKGIDADRGASGACRAQVVFTTHTPVPAGHDRFTAGSGRGAPGPAARRARADARRRSWRSGRVDPRQHRRDVLHDGARAEAAARANAVSSLHGQVSRAMWTAALSRASAKIRSRSGTSPTACTCRRGWRRRCARSTTGTSDPDWPDRARRAGLLGSDRGRRRRRAVGDAPDAEGAAHRLRAAAGGRSRPSGAASRPSYVAQLRRALSLDALTIGFARRFATYKRAESDPAGSRSARGAGERPADARAVRVRRQGASARPARARKSCSRSRG